MIRLVFVVLMAGILTAYAQQQQQSLSVEQRLALEIANLTLNKAQLQAILEQLQAENLRLKTENEQLKTTTLKKE